MYLDSYIFCRWSAQYYRKHWIENTSNRLTQEDIILCIYTKKTTLNPSELLTWGHEMFE